LRISDVAARFGVADETVRRDFVSLERQGLLTREHGGASLVGVDTETPYRRRERDQAGAKRLIAQAAAGVVRDGSTIILDSGTTTHHMVEFLRSKRDLVVITNGISHVADLLANPTTSVVVAGGAVRRASLGAAGDMAVATLEKLHADQCFLATHSFSEDTGVTYPHLEEATVKRAMMAAAAEVTLLADGSKYGRTSMVQVASLNELQRIITSEPIAKDAVGRLRLAGVEVIVVGKGPPEERSEFEDEDARRG
jgi:DeoR/GlpR family transcriptional regulator of sugar metabolism